MDKLFETATRRAYRFDTDKGQLTVEQLWSLPVESCGRVNLTDMAIELYRQLPTNTGLDWLNVSAGNETKIEIVKHKLAIIQHIVETRRAEAIANEEAYRKEQLLFRLEAEQARRKEQNLMDKSDEEIEKLIADLRSSK